MNIDNHIDQLRRQIRETFEQLGYQNQEPPTETILIRDGHFCGRRFHQGKAYAVWFMEENQIKFFDEHDELLHNVVPVAPTDQSVERAA